MKKVIQFLITQTLLLFLIVPNVNSQSYDLKKFPKGSQPREIGIKLTERYLQTPHSHWGNIDGKNKTPFITYPDVCAWLGALWFTKAIKDDDLYQQLVDRFEPLFPQKNICYPRCVPRHIM